MQLHWFGNVVLVLVGLALGLSWRHANHIPADGEDPQPRIPERGRGSVALIPGGGWRAAISVLDDGAWERFMEAPEEERTNLESHFERLEVIGWELFHDFRFQTMKNADDLPTQVLIQAPELRAHCLDSSGRWIRSIDGKGDEDYSGLIRFLAPGEDISDEELARLAEAKAERRRKRSPLA